MWYTDFSNLCKPPTMILFMMPFTCLLKIMRPGVILVGMLLTWSYLIVQLYREEVEKAVKAMKNNKQPCKDGIRSEMISSASFICASLLLNYLILFGIQSKFSPHGLIVSYAQFIRKGHEVTQEITGASLY